MFVGDSTSKVKVKYIASKKTKDFLPSRKLIQSCKKPVVVVTRKDVLTNSDGNQATTGVSTQDEADTIMI